MARLPKVNVWQHRNGIYYLRYTFLGERRMISTRTRDRGEAELTRRRHEETLLNGLDPLTERERLERAMVTRSVSLAQFWPIVQRRHLRDKSAKTAEIYRNNFNNLSKCRFRGGKSIVDIPMRDLNRQIVNTYRDLRLDSGRKPATVNRDVQFLHAVLNLAVEWEYLERNPIEKIRKLKEDNRRDVSNVTAEQIAELISRLPEPIGNVCEFLAYTGRRVQEVLGLRIEDVRLTELPEPHFVANYRVKGGKFENFPLSSLAAEVFLRAKGDRKEGYVFINPNTGTRYYSIHKTHDRWVKRLGITIVGGAKFCLHDYRRFEANRASRNGRKLDEIAEALGHSSSNVTKRYTDARTIPAEFFEGQKRLRKEG